MTLIKYSLLHLILLLSAMLSFAGETGKIAGKVMDAGTGEPLIGASVKILGTARGALTDGSGFYFLVNILPGNYSLQAYTVGYSPLTITDIKCTQDLTSRVDFKLKIAPIKTEGIVVTADRPVVEKDLTATRRTIKMDDLSKMPWDTPEKAMAAQTGVLMKGQEFHIRGGRSDEVNYLVDGISVRDAVDGTTGLLLNSNSLSDLNLLTGVFDAEYGEVMSGVINATVKDGTLGGINIYGNSGSMFSKASGRGYKNFQIDFGRRFLEDNINIFTAGDLTLTDDWDPHQTVVPHQDRQDYSFLSKVTVNLPFNIRSTLLGAQSRSQYGRYMHDWYYAPANYRSDFKKGRLGVISLNHSLSNSAFYKFSAGWFWNKSQFGVRDTFWDINRYWWEDIRFLDYWDNQIYVNEYDKLIFTADYNRYGYDCMLFYRFGNYWKYRSRITDERFGKFDFTIQANKYHQLKYGLDMKKYKIDNIYLYQTARGNPIFDIYQHNPFFLGSYFQDKVEYEGLVVNVGIRYERLDLAIKDIDTNALWANDVKNKNIDAKQFISPRLGLSYVISPSTTFHLGYGRYYQQPQMQYYYQYLKAFDPIEIEGNVLGNPSLKPSASTSMEFGTTTQLNNEWSADVTIYYKDIKDLVGINYIPFPPTSYFQYQNIDFATSKGVEICLKKHYGQHYTGAVRYSISSSEGTGSNASDILENYLSTVSGESLGTLERKMMPLEFDQRNKLVVEGSWFNKEPMTKGFWGWLSQDINASLLLHVGSGLPYTVSIFTNLDKNAAASIIQRTPNTKQLDLKFVKNIKYSFLTADFSFEIFNIFDWDNYNYSYEREVSPYEIYTQEWWPSPPQNDYIEGSPYYEKEGDLNQNGVFEIDEQWTRWDYYNMLYLSNPALSGMPRLFRVGLSIKF